MIRRALLPLGYLAFATGIVGMAYGLGQMIGDLM